MLRHADHVAPGDLGDRDPALSRGLKVEVVGPDTRCEQQLQVRGPRDALAGNVCRPERRRDQHVRRGQMLVELGFGVGERDQLVPPSLQHWPKAERVLRASEQFGDFLRVLTAGIQDHYDLRHVLLLPAKSRTGCAGPRQRSHARPSGGRARREMLRGVRPRSPPLPRRVPGQRPVGGL